ncbi:hypothetical protein DFR52_102800 [Hoeflea marina]|uniref:UrcA family protein n=1 Tax=Hoeflea marina TaxID=274592 RepID=A0A317PML7_9HYPH|nr:hypothetical protein [Hoeflea marina]PWW02132.1 hypothetical protein DFR52_102800 [Hoeflea marina]
MPIHRLLLLCLIAAALAFTGPLARGLSARDAAQPAVIAIAGSPAIQAGGVAASKHCQRGAMAWTSCAIDLGYPTDARQLALVSSFAAHNRSLSEIGRGLREGRFFRPPRLS